MRNSLWWLIGFGFVFTAVFLLELVTSLAHPSMWLPIAFGAAFGLLLTLAPRIRQAARFGLAIAFGAGSSALWIVSGGAAVLVGEVSITPMLVLGIAAIGIVGLFAAGISASRKPRPSLGAVALLMAMGWLIAFFSSGRGGASPMVDWVVLHFGLGQHAAETVVVVFRKIVHLTFYACVALAGYAMAARNGSSRRAAFLAAFAATLTYAAFDELRQATQPDRIGSAWDVLLDLAGGVAAMSLLSIATNRPKRASK